MSAVVLALGKFAIEQTYICRRHLRRVVVSAIPRSFVRKSLNTGPAATVAMEDVHQSEALNDLRPFMIISAYGMCVDSRILLRLKNNIGDPRSTILITGY